MKKFYYINVVVLLLTCEINAQYPVAPETWSVPKKIAVISDTLGRAESPSISWDGQYLYFNWIGVCEWSDTGWSVPYRLNNNINQHLANYPCISPNGKRLFFTWYVGGWDLYYSDWDSTINDWGAAVNCGQGVNEPEWAEGKCTLPNDTTLIFTKTSDVNISYWDSKTQSWGQAERWPTPYLWYTSDLGIYVSPDFGKVYDTGTRTDTTIGGDKYLNYDIYVSYRDSTNPMGYKPPRTLNFCLYADTQYFAGNYADRFEGYPTLTPDGKKIYFTANYDGQTTIYESDMLIDENGDTVTNAENNYKPRIIPQEIELYPAYPNPFNPTKTIEYTLKKEGKVTLKIFDTVGKEIKTLVNQSQQSGNYKVVWDGTNNKEEKVSSGIYFYRIATHSDRLKIDKPTVTKKAVFIK